MRQDGGRPSRLATRRRGRPSPTGCRRHGRSLRWTSSRWREWMRRIEAVLFASARPVSRQALARVVGQGASVEALVADLRADLAERPYDVVAVAEGFLLRTRPAYAPAIRAAADLGEASPELVPWDLAVLAAIAYRQPIARDDLSRAFGREVSRELMAACARATSSPRAPAAPVPARPTPSSRRKPSSRPSTSRTCRTCRMRRCWGRRGCEVDRPSSRRQCACRPSFRRKGPYRTVLSANVCARRRTRARGGCPSIRLCLQAKTLTRSLQPTLPSHAQANGLMIVIWEAAMKPSCMSSDSSVSHPATSPAATIMAS